MKGKLNFWLKSWLGWDIQNRGFQKLFLKNWVLVFICIMLPLFTGVFFMQRYSNQSILREVDTAIQRSADNTTATMKTLFTEAESILKKEIRNDDVKAFLQTKPSIPQSYEDIVMVRSVLKTVTADCRESLYFSVDAYSEASERIISSYYKGQHYTSVKDLNIRELFYDALADNPEQTMFAVPRMAYGSDGKSTRVITIYQTSADTHKDGFVSISVDVEKLISHITSEEETSLSTYLLVGEDGTVVMDTSGLYHDQVLNYLADGSAVFPMTREINGQTMRIGMNDLGLLGWNCVQMVPVSELEANSLRLRNLLIEIILFGMFAACFISYHVTRRLFRPVRSILELLENPSNEMLDVEEREEYRFLLVQILELFQKNITLESAMAERVVALRSARAKALQGQLTPHFLNNVLQTINWIAIEETAKEHSRTSEAITLLADVIRVGKEQKTNFTTVEAEIAYTKKFVELELLRYGKGIRCHFDVDSSLNQVSIPCISIQPLVENAILHGLQPVGGEGDIYVTLRKSGTDGLLICVEDSGEGIKQEEIDRIFAFMKEEYIYLGEHLGIVNLFQRFRLLYGESCRFQICQSRYGGACFEILISQPVEQIRNG